MSQQWQIMKAPFEVVSFVRSRFQIINYERSTYTFTVVLIV